MCSGFDGFEVMNGVVCVLVFDFEFGECSVFGDCGQEVVEVVSDMVGYE